MNMTFNNAFNENIESKGWGGKKAVDVQCKEMWLAKLTTHMALLFKIMDLT